MLSSLTRPGGFCCSRSQSLSGEPNRTRPVFSAPCALCPASTARSEPLISYLIRSCTCSAPSTCARGRGAGTASQSEWLGRLQRSTWSSVVPFFFFSFFFFFLFLLRNYSLLLAGSRRVLTMTMLTSVGQSVGRSVDEESTGWVSRQSWEQPRPTRGGNGEHRTAQKRSTQ